jgi:pantoate--beta-alanine ligase
MKIIRSASAMQREMLRVKKTKSIGFVPTMGYLHAGHLKLVSVAQKQTDVVVVSIFVNPTQFGPNEDLSRYPRDTKGDLAKLKKAGVDYVYFPTVAQMYPEGYHTYVNVESITDALCGKSRPGHFRGVTTVVCKLFNIVQPTVAVFGKKDYQQYRVIETMVRDLNLPVKIVGVETEREKDGLAMSSRNKYLNAEERQLALSISQGLKKVRAAAQAKSLSASAMCRLFENALPKDKRLCLDYVDCRDAVTLVALSAYRPKRTLIATAVFVGKTRLIDNIVF